MEIHLVAPFERGFQRMKSALFQPFDLRTWLVVGFTAFLAHLLEGGGTGTNYRKETHSGLGEVLAAPYQALDWIKSQPEWAALVAAGIILALAIFALLVWLTSRGKFMFLDNVVERRALVVQPWHQFRDLGYSLFIWRLLFSAFAAVLLGGIVYHLWQVAWVHWNEFGDLWSLIPSLVLWGAILVILLLALGYILLMLDHFVVPLMYRDKLTAAAAWQKFLSIHWQHAGSFIAYALFMLVVMIAIVMLVILGGLFTCCLGFVLLAIPYINSVVLLPLSYWIRAFSLDYLGQFGAEFQVWRPEQTAESAVTSQTEEP